MQKILEMGSTMIKRARRAAILAGIALTLLPYVLPTAAQA